MKKIIFLLTMIMLITSACKKDDVNPGANNGGGTVTPPNNNGYHANIKIITQGNLNTELTPGHYSATRVGNALTVTLNDNPQDTMELVMHITLSPTPDQTGFYNFVAPSNTAIYKANATTSYCPECTNSSGIFQIDVITSTYVEGSWVMSFNTSAYRISGLFKIAI